MKIHQMKIKFLEDVKVYDLSTSYDFSFFSALFNFDSNQNVGVLPAKGV